MPDQRRSDRRFLVGMMVVGFAPFAVAAFLTLQTRALPPSSTQPTDEPDRPTTEQIFEGPPFDNVISRHRIDSEALTVHVNATWKSGRPEERAAWLASVADVWRSMAGLHGTVIVRDEVNNAELARFGVATGLVVHD